jgi:hypothetical protein
MEVLGFISFIILAFIVFALIGVCGWLLEIFRYVFEFLWEGFTKSLGCLFWVFVITLLILALCN